MALATARATDAIAALLGAGVTLPVALSRSAAVAGDAHCGAALLRARERLMRGDQFSTAAHEEQALTPTAIRLARAGEETGRLAAMLREAAVIERERSANLIRRMLTLIEPTFILAFGGLVALVAAALLQALYGIRPS